MDRVEVIAIRRSHRYRGVLEIYATTESDRAPRRVGVIASASGGWGIVMALSMLAARSLSSLDIAHGLTILETI